MIIAGYSGIGKTYYADHTEGVLDFHIVPYKYHFPEGYDPSTYTEADKARDDLEFEPDYPALYCQDLLKVKDEYRHVLIPTDERILRLLRKFEIPFLTVIPLPDDDTKEEYALRFAKRGNSENFSEIFIGQWYERISSLMGNKPVICLGREQYLSDVMLPIDTALDKIRVDSVHLATLIDIRESGLPLDIEDVRTDKLGDVMWLALLRENEDEGIRAFFFSWRTYEIDTKPGTVTISGNTVTHTDGKLTYTWQLQDEGMPKENYHLVKEAYVTRKR